MPAEGVVSPNPAGIGGGVPQFGGALGMPSGGGASDARSRTHAVERAAEVFGVQRDGVHQGQERDSSGAGVRRATKELRGAAFLGARILGIDGGQKRGGSPPLYPGAGERRQTPRTNGDGGALSASR